MFDFRNAYFSCQWFFARGDAESVKIATGQECETTINTEKKNRNTGSTKCAVELLKVKLCF